MTFWQKYSKCSRIEYAGSSCRVGLLFYQLFVFQAVTENNANFENYASHCLSTWHRMGSVPEPKIASFSCVVRSCLIIDFVPCS